MPTAGSRLDSRCDMSLSLVWKTIERPGREDSAWVNKALATPQLLLASLPNRPTAQVKKATPLPPRDPDPESESFAFPRLSLLLHSPDWLTELEAPEIYLRSRARVIIHIRYGII